MDTKKLAEFIKKEDFSKVSKEIVRLLSNKSNIFDVLYEGEVIPTLHLAAEYDKKGEIIEKLIDEGADIERMRYQPFDTKKYKLSYGKGDCTALTFAVINQNYNAVDKLLNLGADANGRKDTIENPIIYSICLDDIEDAKKFTLLLVSWDAKFVKNDLFHILDRDCKKVKSYISNSIIKKIDYNDDYFFSGNKKERKNLIEIIDEAINELSEEEDLEEEENLEENEDLEEDEDLEEEE